MTVSDNIRTMQKMIAAVDLKPLYFDSLIAGAEIAERMIEDRIADAEKIYGNAFVAAFEADTMPIQDDLKTILAGAKHSFMTSSQWIFSDFNDEWNADSSLCRALDVARKYVVIDEKRRNEAAAWSAARIESALTRGAQMETEYAGRVGGESFEEAVREMRLLKTLQS
jgi:hypothetical protein